MKRTGIAAFAFVAACSFAQAPGGTPPRDPWVPPEVRKQPHPGHETRGDALRGQVERKLRDSFEAADTEGRGTITREQAHAAGLGFIADNFDAIDVARAGRVAFDDVKRFLRSRGARTL